MLIRIVKKVTETWSTMFRYSYRNRTKQPDYLCVDLIDREPYLPEILR